MVSIPPPLGLGRDTRARAAARDALARVLWTPDGQRRLPTEKALVDALHACDERDVWWVCEMSSAGPVYFLPTTTWVSALARWLDSTGAKKVLEVGAGDGFLSRCVQEARPELRVVASDSGAWSRPAARMSAEERRRFQDIPVAGIPMQGVVKMSAVAAVKEHQPDVVLVAWPPPGTLVDRVVRSPSQLVLDISVDGDVCGNGTRTWRFNKEFLEGPLQDKALCRLDARPRQERATRVTLYFGANHPEHGVDEGFA